MEHTTTTTTTTTTRSTTRSTSTSTRSLSSTASLTSTPTLSNAPTISPAPSTESSSGGPPIGAIIGGVAGGIALVLISVGAIAFIRKRKQRQQDLEHHRPFDGQPGFSNTTTTMMMTTGLRSGSTPLPLEVVPKGGMEPQNQTPLMLLMSPDQIQQPAASLQRRPASLASSTGSTGSSSKEVIDPNDIVSAYSRPIASHPIHPENNNNTNNNQPSPASSSDETNSLTSRSFPHQRANTEASIFDAYLSSTPPPSSNSQPPFPGGGAGLKPSPLDLVDDAPVSWSHAKLGAKSPVLQEPEDEFEFDVPVSTLVRTATGRGNFVGSGEEGYYGEYFAEDEGRRRGEPVREDDEEEGGW
ncbi:hypothetical protein HDV05_007427 [Chytridiales sp. JEL 0842]|nr:hypothetical protein HDV05_007427 [Chytridiales sp. JEL 0842]